MHFLEATQFLNAPVLAGRKVNRLYTPGLAARPPPIQLFGPWNNHYVLICIKLPMNLFFYLALALMILKRGKDFTRAIGRVGPWKSRLFWALKQLEQSESCLGPKKLRLSWPNPSNGPSNVFAPQQNHKGQGPYNQQVHWQFYANENRVVVSGPKHFTALVWSGGSLC